MYAYFLHYASLSQCSWKLSQTNKEFFDCMLKKSFEKNYTTLLPSNKIQYLLRANGKVD